MRAPTSLDDRDPLQDEPFATVFSARPNRRKKPLSREVLDKISDLLEKDAGHYTAVENWLKLAFEPDESYRKRDYKFRRQNGGRKHSRKALKYFVNFYWYLFCGHDPMEVLRSQNLEGYVNTTRKVPRFSVKREPFDEPMSPLTDLEDDDGISPFAAAQDEVVMLQSVTEAQCRSGEPIGIAVPTFPIKDEELTVSLVLEPSQNVLMAPAFPADAGVSTAPGVFAAEPTLESESLDSGESVDPVTHPRLARLQNYQRQSYRCFHRQSADVVLVAYPELAPLQNCQRLSYHCFRDHWFRLAGLRMHLARFASPTSATNSSLFLTIARASKFHRRSCI
ncbi:hypothetical protein C8R46DRAFT_598784 [Mycena filopes]|nr:hypothetical protein C8R46DRAFT_598784 [Mycena filopes]